LLYRFISYVILRFRCCPGISRFKGTLVWYMILLNLFIYFSLSLSHECEQDSSHVFGIYLR
jgi:hypothetical protein